MTTDFPKLMQALELTCEKCFSEREIIVDRKADGKIVRFGQEQVTTDKPSKRGKLCYFHRKTKQGSFQSPKRIFPRQKSVFTSVRF